MVRLVWLTLFTGLILVAAVSGNVHQSNGADQPEPWVYFERSDPNRSCGAEIWRAHIDGSGKEMVLPAASNTRASRAPDEPANGSFDVSGDGRFVVRSLEIDRTSEDAQNRDALEELYVYDLLNGTVNRLTNNSDADYSPVFSSDATKIAYIRLRRSQPFIYFMKIDGTGVTRVSSSRDLPVGPSWDPGRDRIAFTDRKLYVVDTRTGSRRAFIGGPDDRRSHPYSAGAESASWTRFGLLYSGTSSADPLQGGTRRGNAPGGWYLTKTARRLHGRIVRAQSRGRYINSPRAEFPFADAVPGGRSLIGEYNPTGSSRRSRYIGSLDLSSGKMKRLGFPGDAGQPRIAPRLTAPGTFADPPGAVIQNCPAT